MRRRKVFTGLKSKRTIQTVDILAKIIPVAIAFRKTVFGNSTQIETVLVEPALAKTVSRYVVLSARKRVAAYGSIRERNKKNLESSSSK